MKKALLIMAALLLAGCVGSCEPRNPLDRDTEVLWWQRTTVGVSFADNPWEKFNQPKVTENPLDPWGSFQEPGLFTPEFIRREKARRAEEQALRKKLRDAMSEMLYPKEY